MSTVAASAEHAENVLTPTTVDDDRRVAIVRTDSPPVLDGVLDDHCWAEAGRTSVFFNERSFEPCTEQTTVYLTYDMENLYVAFECMESVMSSLRAYEYRDDRRQVFRDDFVEVQLDTFHDHRNCYVFVTNAVGARFDSRKGVATGKSSGEVGWDCDWQVATSRADDRWFAEISIPFSELLFDREDGQTWGVNFMREEQRLVEEGYWSLRNDDPGHVRNFGHIDGLDLADAARQRKLWVSPYISAMYDSNSDDDFDANVGFDMTYKITSDMKAAFTVNPDFGQVEADTDDIVLRDVERLLPERRPYFEEGMELFDTPLRGLFYSRRIFDIDYGAKVSGKADSYSLAALDVEGQIARSGERLSGNFAAVRALRDIGRESAVGVLATSSEHENGYNRVAALDASLRLPYDLEVESQYAMSWRGGKTIQDTDEETYPEGSEHAFVLDIDHGEQPFWIGAEYRDIGKNFRPDLAYVSRRDIRGGTVMMRFSDDSTSAPYHKASASAYTTLYENHDGQTVLRDYEMSGRVTLKNGFAFGMRLKKGFRVPYENFEDDPPDPLLPPYNNREAGVSFELNSLDNWHSTQLYFAAGEFENIPYNRVAIEKRLTALDRLTLEIEGELRRDELEDGDDNVWLTSAVGNYAITDDIWLKGFVQYRDRRQHNINLILKWELSNQLDWYVAYSDTQSAGESPTRTMFTKLVYNF